jgi:hypothetical protein
MTPLLRVLPFRGLPRVLANLWFPLGLALSSFAVPAQTVSADGWNPKLSAGGGTESNGRGPGRPLQSGERVAEAA